MNAPQLAELSRAVRHHLLELNPGKKAHLQSSLGVTELTLALHHILDTPNDSLIWDVGHQAYVHKWITGRHDELSSIRSKGGISGFPNRSESVFDPFGTGHSSTAISAIGGMAHADRENEEQKKYVAVIGDGALTGGLAFEALNHLVDLGLDVLVVLNDNARSLHENVGSLHKHRAYKAFFQSLDWNYNGPVDGHDMEQLLPSLQEASERKGLNVLHVITKHPASEDKPQPKVPRDSGAMSFSEVFGRTMHEFLERKEDVYVVSPAMLSAAYLTELKKEFPQRVIDTGITEQHAVTFSAGLAAKGKRVFCHLYSTFSQRAIDQIIHDVALQNLPVTFVLDRAGVTGSDGPTHHGVFDLGLFRVIPNMEIWDAVNGDRLSDILNYSLNSTGPLAVRIPRSDTHLSAEEHGELVPIQTISGEGFHGRIVVGHACERAQNELFKGPLAILNQVKPLNQEELYSFLRPLKSVEIWEDNSRMGGIAEQISLMFSQLRIKVVSKAVPDQFLPHATTDELWKDYLL